MSTPVRDANSARPGWAWLLVLAACALAACAPALRPDAVVLLPERASVLVSASSTAPGPEAAWTPVSLPDWRPAKVAWYRVEFEVPSRRTGSWALYLPYFYGGGRVLLNGQLATHVPSAESGHWVRWERPHLIDLPEAALQTGVNIVLLRAEASPISNSPTLPLLAIGDRAELQALYERRLFWARTLPQFTVLACVVAGAATLLVWWRRRSEVVYGLFGLTALMWGARTLTFVIEVLPQPWWPYWRLLYHSATGGFIVVLTLFTMRLAQLGRPRVERALLAYWALGPLAYLVSGSEDLVGRFWIGGMMPVGLAMVAFSFIAAWRQRNLATLALAASVCLGVACGVHDYLAVIGSPVLQALAPGWAAHRIFLLHHGANLMLLVMGAILTARFIAALEELELLNRTLEVRIEKRESELAANYERMAGLQRAQAAADERSLIMRDLHDGLGSMLFTSLSRAERMQLQPGELAQTLRECITEMRLTLEALVPDGDDFTGALGSFRFRWQALLQAQGVASDWQVDLPDETLKLAPQRALQLLRVLQEALTNVLRHSQASKVEVVAVVAEGWLTVRVADNGRGMQGVSQGRGLHNMQARANRLGGRLTLLSDPGRTEVRIELPLDDTAGTASFKGDASRS